MKKIFTTLAIAAGICFSAKAQTALYFDHNYFQSVNAPTNSVVPHTGTTPGLAPSDSALPCATRFGYVSDTIYFTNFTASHGITVTSLKIDSLYLPAGLSWSTNKSNNTFGTAENGVILVQGVATGPAGQYKLRIIVDVNGILTNQNAETLAGLRYDVRVSCAGDPCPALITSDTVSTFIASTSATSCGGVGINEVSSNITDLSVAPNPFDKTATVSFSSENQGKYTVRMTNLIGAVVATKEVNINEGHNDITIDRNGLSSGLYLLSISNGKSAITRKVVID